MLFSNAAIATFMDNHFEPVWVSMRPVPQITIDFGNGHRIKRTLHGNVATWVCAADGTAIDVLPGTYAPEVWVQEIEKLKTVHEDFAAIEKSRRRQFLHDYHQTCLKLDIPSAPSFTESAESIFGLHQDTQLNQTTRRRTIHQFLGNQSPATPDLFANWLYREVLGANLEDPYLGLGKVLFKNYPFEDEQSGNDLISH
ncbi:MAG: hypothetical protein P8J91_07785 [Pirellulaceae bacterium]|nr:hypothetical protein [Pirellulaceae bacterium]